MVEAHLVDLPAGFNSMVMQVTGPWPCASSHAQVITMRSAGFTSQYWPAAVNSLPSFERMVMR